MAIGAIITSGTLTWEVVGNGVAVAPDGTVVTYKVNTVGFPAHPNLVRVAVFGLNRRMITASAHTPR